MRGKLNASGGNEAAVRVKTRIGWIKLIGCGELLYGRKSFVENEKKSCFMEESLSLKTKIRIYHSCVRSTMLYQRRRGVKGKMR